MNNKMVSVIVVTYNPNINDFTKNIKEVCKYQARVIVVDNCSLKNRKRKIKELSKELGFKLYELASNLGIGYAQNYGILKENNSDYYFFLDQDSYITVNQFNKLLQEFIYIEKNINKKIAALGPAIYNKNCSQNKFTCVNQVISSGSLISKKAFHEIGLMKDNFFIDYIDYEWCWRAIYKGWYIYRSNDVEIQHETGGVPRKNGHTVDPIFRLFYIYRNSTYILFHERVHIKFKLNMIVRLMGKLFFQIRLDKPIKRWKTCFFGIYDGIKGDF